LESENLEAVAGGCRDSFIFSVPIVLPSRNIKRSRRAIKSQFLGGRNESMLLCRANGKRAISALSDKSGKSRNRAFISGSEREV
jgi:hypothetical protein